jgi:hypothetical protein
MAEPVTRRGLVGHALGAAAAVGMGRYALAAPASDPMLDVVTRYRAAMATAGALPASEQDAFNMGPLRDVGRQLWHETPEVRSSAGAAAALRLILEHEEVDEEDARVVRAVVAFLEREG